MAIATAELVLFALRAGVRLGRAARTAYVDSIRMREIALPIPNAGFTLDVIHARTAGLTEFGTWCSGTNGNAALTLGGSAQLGQNLGGVFAQAR